MSLRQLLITFIAFCRALFKIIVSGLRARMYFPEDCFIDARIDPEKAPLAFLLKLSDSLQDWERPSKINSTGLSANLFNIEIRNNKLIYRYCTMHGTNQSSIKYLDDLPSIYSAFVLLVFQVVDLLFYSLISSPH